MFRFIKLLFTGDWHLHDWEIYRDGPLRSGGVIIGHYFHQKCKHCGKLKFVRHQNV